jgi:putative transcriptional regulator
MRGSVGFIINKPLKYTINDLIPEVRARFKIYNGGPVEQDNLYFIHNIPDLILIVLRSQWYILGW